MVIVPTELISDNGKKLESIVIELAHLNGLEEAFIDWLENANRFCNSLVDRIVPGKPDEVLQRSIETRLGYTDELLIMSEVYRLWAIEGDEEIAETLSFARAGRGGCQRHQPVPGTETQAAQWYPYALQRRGFSFRY